MSLLQQAQATTLPRDRTLRERMNSLNSQNRLGPLLLPVVTAGMDPMSLFLTTAKAHRTRRMAVKSLVCLIMFPFLTCTGQRVIVLPMSKRGPSLGAVAPAYQTSLTMRPRPQRLQEPLSMLARARARPRTRVHLELAIELDPVLGSEPAMPHRLRPCSLKNSTGRCRASKCKKSKRNRSTTRILHQVPSQHTKMVGHPSCLGNPKVRVTTNRHRSQ